MPPSLSCLNLPVFTTLGHKLGRVVGVEVDAATHQVVHYQVASGVALPQLWHRHVLLIAPAQVVSLTERAMVVKDEVVSRTASVQPNLAATPTA